MSFSSTKIIELGSCAFRQPEAKSHCRFIHGYRLVGKFWFGAKELDENNWVVDFGGLKNLKKVLQLQFDHTTVISSTDPAIANFKSLNEHGIIDLRIMEGGVGIEKFAEFCYKTADEYVKEVTNNRCWCKRVEIFEHENNSAIYEGIETEVRLSNE
jgi:6-pyruvoyltetrahydropterin/6-carboxytetrahydropterin synthase